MEIMLMIISWLVMAASIFVAVSLALASVFDARLLRARASMRTALRRGNRSKNPPITVLIYNASDADSITACLHSLNRCRYKNMDIVVVDNRTTLSTRRVIRAALPVSRRPIVFYAIRKRISESAALLQAYKKSQRGEIILAIAPSSIVSSSLLREIAVRRHYLAQNQALKLAVRESREPQIKTLAAIFMSLSQIILEKARSVILRQATTRRTGYVFADSMFRRLDQTISSQFDAGLFMYPSASKGSMDESIKRRMIRLLAALGTLLIGYITLFAAITFVTYTPLLVAWGLLGFWLAGVVWLDEQTSLHHKLMLSLALPSSFFMLLVFLMFRPLLAFLERYQPVWSHKITAKFM